jgi:hypothetical protein
LLCISQCEWYAPLRVGIAQKSLSSSAVELDGLSRLTTPEKVPKRRRRKRIHAGAAWRAVIVGILLGGGLAALQLQEDMPRWSQVPVGLFAAASVAALLLVTAALTNRLETGLLCGAVAAVTQFLALLGFYAYSYTIDVAIAVVPFQSLRILMYPVAGVIGGYIGGYIPTERSLKLTRHMRGTGRS